MEKTIYKVGDVLDLKFEKSKSDMQYIARTENKMIVFIDNHIKSKISEEVAKYKISKVFDTKIIVRPLEIFNIGDVLKLELEAPIKGDTLIAHTENGMICLIDKSIKWSFNTGSIWDCEIIKVDETKLIVKPINQISTASANLENAMSKLADCFKKPEAVKKPKITKIYPYMSAVEKKTENK